MKKSILLFSFVFFVSALSHLHAQSINNKNWKAYLDTPINDTVIFHIQSDSSFVTNSNGDVVIRIHCTITGDTLIIVNQEADEHGCLGQQGKYKINFTGDNFTLALIEDPCEGRGHALQNVKWRDATK